jgi:hypothetical protein
MLSSHLCLGLPSGLLPSAVVVVVVINIMVIPSQVQAKKKIKHLGRQGIRIRLLLFVSHTLYQATAMRGNRCASMLLINKSTL